MKRLRTSTLIVGLVAAAMIPPLPARADVLVFPGPAPCNTLSGCVTAADDGDTVRIRTNGPIEYDGWGLVKKNITLEAAAGYEPVIRDDPANFSKIYVTEDDSATPINVTIRGITFRNVGILLGNNNFATGGRHRLVVVDSVFSNSWEHNNESLLDLRLGEAGTIIVRNNRLSATGHVVSFWSPSISGPTKLTLESNRIASASSDLENSWDGVELHTSGTSPATMNVRSNSIHGPFQNAGLSLRLGQDSVGFTNIVGNTIHHTPDEVTGVEVSMDGTGPISHDLAFYNNIFSNLDGGAFRFSGNDPSLDVTGSHNAFYRSGGSDLEGYEMGSPSFDVAPRYVSAADYDLRLKPSSPLIDRGRTCSPGGLSRGDARWRFRLFGPSVDVGAFEAGSTKKPPRGKNVFGSAGPDLLSGTPGRDVMCGFAGEDLLRGFGGRDRLYAGTGKDTLKGFGKADLLVTRDGKGNDRALGGRGDDRCRTDPGDTRSSC